MRALFAGLIFLAASTATAAAQPWSAEDSRLVFEAPDGWTTTRAPTATRTYVVARGEPGECHFLTVAREATASETPYRLRLASAEPLAETVWSNLPNVLPRVFGENARLLSSRVDADGFWPIHFGTYQSPGRTVHTAAQFRPGMEFWGFCYASAETTSTDNPFDAVLRSMADRGDGEMRASIEEEQSRRQANLRADMERSVEDQRRRFENLPPEFLGTSDMTPPTSMGGAAGGVGGN